MTQAETHPHHQFW